uniref:V-type proton ATPase subunit F n=1 Tax=Oncorhynchus kisutch TaxID=8019 RepID=A0A8C7G7J7_ONCKI
MAGRGKLIAVIGDEDTCTGFLLGGIGELNKNRKPNFLVVEKETSIAEIEETFKSFLTRNDIGIILINQFIAEMIRHAIDQHMESIPAVLEIPSKEHPYDASKDSILRRAKGILCLGGSDIFATVGENSPVGEFIANLSIIGDPTGVNSIRLCLTGENANWFYLEGRTIRLNSSVLRVLDRERQGSVLMAALTCYEDDIIQVSEYRVIVEILNENDNKPKFVEKTIQPRYISELTAVNSVVFTVKAIDADGDTITYIIDRALPDASYFRIDLPNSGKVILDKPLDYETKTQLQLVIYAVETNTKEWYNTSASLTVHVKDGDDQYPQFLPCTPISQDNKHTVVCTNPVYTVNITEKDQDMLLNFSPGPIHAEDGDRSLDTPLLYSILSGADKNRFQIDNQTAEITLTRRVENRHLTPTFRLRIMASQLNDPKKYSVATALVRVLAENRFPPLFNRTTYKGFIVENSSPATLVSTYGNEVLLIQAIDQDFVDGVNPKMHYSLPPTSATTALYHITQEGVIIAKTDRLRPFERHFLEVRSYCWILAGTGIRCRTHFNSEHSKLSQWVTCLVSIQATEELGHFQLPGIVYRFLRHGAVHLPC